MIRLTQQQIENWVARNFDYRKAKGGRQLRINNPFCQDDDYHFWISTEPTTTKKGIRGYWVHDWRDSDYNYSFLGFVKKYKGISFFEAVAEVTNGTSKQIRDELRRLRQKQTEEEIEIKEESICLPHSESFAEPKNQEFKEMALRYLRKRAVDEKLAISLGLRFTPVSIIFPYIEYGITCYWQERYTLEKRFEFPDESKTGLKKTDFLYNYDNVEQPSEHVAVVESIFNCISVGDNCVATGGAALGEKQVQKLRVLGPRLVVLAPDLDEAGIKSLKENYYLLKDSFRVGVCLPPKSLKEQGKKDWNDMDQLFGKKAVRDYFQNNTCRLDPIVVHKLLSRL